MDSRQLEQGEQLGGRQVEYGKQLGGWQLERDCRKVEPGESLGRGVQEDHVGWSGGVGICVD